MKKILSLDLATKCGYCLTAPGSPGAVESGVNTFDVKRGESPGMRYVRFRKWLTETIDMVEPEMVVYEQTIPHGRAGIASEIAHGFATRVQEVCAERDINHTTFYAATIKKFATGKGNAKKPQVIQAVIDRWGIEPADDNEADAVALYFLAQSEFGDA